VLNQTQQHDEQLTNLSQLIKLLQNYSDAQEDDLATVKRSLTHLHQRLDSEQLSENKAGTGTQRRQSPKKKQRSPSKSPNRHSNLAKQSYEVAAMDERMINLERQVNILDYNSRSSKKNDLSSIE
jgi:hypothetical protein